MQQSGSIRPDDDRNAAHGDDRQHGQWVTGVGCGAGWRDDTRTQFVRFVAVGGVADLLYALLSSALADLRAARQMAHADG